MSERPTPETDEQINGKPITGFAICAGDSLRDAFVPSEFARKLERERDEAREELEDLKVEYEIISARLRGQKHERDNGIVSDDEIIPKLIRERDEWKSKFIQANKDYGFELRDPCGTIWDHAKKLQQERDKMRSALQRLADCDFVITPRDRMDAVREIAREALAKMEAAK